MVALSDLIAFQQLSNKSVYISKREIFRRVEICKGERTPMSGMRAVRGDTRENLPSRSPERSGQQSEHWRMPHWG